MYFNNLTTNSRKSSQLYTAGLSRLWPCLITILLRGSAVFDTDSASSPTGHKTLLGEGEVNAAGGVHRGDPHARTARVTLPTDLGSG